LIENRKHARRPGNNQAALIYPGLGEPPIMCTIADISEGGAGLTVINTKAIPETFELQIKTEEARRACRVAWRKEPHKLGVQFETEPRAVLPEGAVNPAAAR
jgi:PilZ domain